MEVAKDNTISRLFAYFGMLKATFTPNFLAFLFMRITGVGLALFLILHLWTIGQVQRGENAFNAAMASYDNPLGWVLEYLLLLAVLLHMFNGLRLIAADFFNLTDRQGGMLWLAGVCVALVGAASITVFF